MLHFTSTAKPALPVLIAASLLWGCGPVPGIDAGPSPADGGQAFDAGQNATASDAGTTHDPNDAGAPPHDAGTQSTQGDAGAAMDAGTAPSLDAGNEVVADGGTAPADDAGTVAITIGGIVRSSAGGAIEDASVDCDCGETTVTDANGEWTLTLPAQAVTLTYAAEGHTTASVVVDPTDSAAPWDDVTLDALDDPLVSVIDHAFLIDHFGGNVVDALTYEDSEAGLQAYLDDVGVTYFSANEVVTPNNQTAATNCGYDILLPTRDLWERIGALALFADQLRALVGEPVLMRNWWRPPCYNMAVGGAATGDHPDADAVDLDFQSNASRGLAQGYLCENYWLNDIVAPDEVEPGSGLNPRLNMSVGLGGVSIHLGVLSQNGRRFWKYNSYTTETGIGTCW